MHPKKTSTLLGFLLVLTLPLHAFAVPAYLSHQGHILDSSNQPLSGVVDLTFTLYDSASGGSIVWDETLSVTFDNGFYSVVLGTDTEAPILASYFDGSDRYLGITMSGAEEMTPRFMVTSVPYAMRAGVATSADSVEGPVNVQGGLLVGGNQIIDGSGNITTDGTVTADLFSGDGSELTGINTGLWSEGDDTEIYYNGGNVGIGTATPSSALEVDGDIKATGDIITDNGQLSGATLSVSGATIDTDGSASVNDLSVVGALRLGDSTTCESQDAGTLRWHDSQVEVCDGESWIAVYEAPAPAPEGGEITTYSNYVVHTFTSSGTFTAHDNIAVEYLVVAGGGGGGGQNCGGGGGGGMLTGSTNLTANSYSIVIGAGGTAGGPNDPGGDGGDSSAFDITATGGGGGGDNGAKGRTGGSGGGSGWVYTGSGGDGISGQGHNGTRSSVSNGTDASGAGGGAGGTGDWDGENPDASYQSAPDGGPGLQSNIDGNNYYYAGGGGGAKNHYGGDCSSWHGGDGGIGGGGGGGSNGGDTGGIGGGSARNSGTDGGGSGSCAHHSETGGNGGENTGGGGGSGTRTSGVGGVGGSGIVIIRYEQ